MKNENLEDKVGEASFLQKIRSSVKKHVIGYLVGVSLSLGTIYGSGCGGGPSDYCCGTLQCGEQGQICDGEDENCYCREKTCCERAECGYDYHCDQDSWGDTCGCVQDRDYDIPGEND